MHHKRKRTQSRRAGCKLCKPWKKNGCREHSPRDRRKLQDQVKDLRDEAA